jgi:histidinol-phosphatase (PHP family)
MRDYHMHSHWCRHASGRLEEYARSAVALGIDEICFTPHIPLPGFRPGFFHDRIRMDLEEFDGYEEELARTRARFPGLSILSGVEADHVEGMERFLEGFLSAHSFDLVLMSVHFVGCWPEDTWVFHLPRERSLERIYAEYFRAMRQGIATGLFDCIAHLDLIKQPGAPVLATNRGEVEGILSLCRERGMSIEINTSGTRKQIAETYPCPDIVRMALEREVSLVLGSDAHSPAQIAVGFDGLLEDFGLGLEPRVVRYSAREALSVDPVATPAAQVLCRTKLK